MLRTTLIALAAASALGISAASAASLYGSVISAAAFENGALQEVQWYGYRHHHHWYRHHHYRRGW
jgi:hypothetical protein